MHFDVADRRETTEGWRCRVEIPERHPSFEGHFPEHPVFPGVAHLAVALHVLDAVPGGPAEIAAVPLLRLRRPVAPGDVLEVAVGRPSPDGTVAFEILRGGERVSHGILLVRRRE